MYDRTYQQELLRQKQPAPKKRGKKIPLIIAILGTILLLTGIVFLLRASFLQVRTIVVEGTAVADPEEIKVFLKKQMEGKRLGVLPKTNIALVSVRRLEKRLQEQYPRFSKVQVSRQDFHTLVVSVLEYKGEYLWCEKPEDMFSCYFMDTSGVVFSPAPLFSGSAYVRIIAGELQSLPFAPLTKAQLELFKKYHEALRELGIAPTSFMFTSAYSTTITFSYHNEPTPIFINPSYDADITLKNIEAAFISEPFKSAFKRNNRSLEYIDARFTNKVIYKFK